MTGPLRVAAGSTNSYTDRSGNVWIADTNYNVGSTVQNTDTISGTSDPSLYHGERYASRTMYPNGFTYTFSVSNGSYSVLLRFAETSTGHITGAGQRQFNATINGTPVLTNFDIYAAAGAQDVAVDRQFATNVTDGQIVVQLSPGAMQNPKINAIAIVPSSASGTSGTAHFGLDINSLSDGWPSAPAKVGILRLWDDGLRWDALQPTCGALDSTTLSTLGRWLDLAGTNGTKVNYTIGHVPACAGGGNVKPAAATSFLTALGKYSADRKAAGHPGIDYYELMNEPNNSPAGGGGDIDSPTVLAKYMQAAYRAIKANDSSAMVVSPSAAYTAHAGWPDSTPWGATGDYLAAARALGDVDYPFFDYQAYHYYLANYATSVQPERVVGGITNMRAVMSKYGISGKPLVNTEFSWGNSSPTTAADLAYQSNFLARSYVLYFANKTDMWWYGWGFTGYGCLWAPSGGVRPAGLVYEQLSSWLEGATVGAATTNGNVYTVPVTLASSQKAALVVWDTATSSTFTVPTQFRGKIYRTLKGNSGVPGATITIGESPILLSE